MKRFVSLLALLALVFSVSSCAQTLDADTAETTPNAGGKTSIPFTVHGGSGFAGTPQTIADLQPNATVIMDGLPISRNSVADAEASVVQWVQRLGLTQ